MSRLSLKPVTTAQVQAYALMRQRQEARRLRRQVGPRQAEPAAPKEKPMSDSETAAAIRLRAAEIESREPKSKLAKALRSLADRAERGRGGAAS